MSERRLSEARTSNYVSLTILMRVLTAVSFTGSEKIGKEVGKAVQDRFGKASRTSFPLAKLTVSLCLSLEETMVCIFVPGKSRRKLTNQAVIVDKDADLDLAMQAVLFAAVGTA